MKTKAKVKKVVKAGTSLLVYLPQDFVDRTELKKGDEVVVTYDNSMLTVMPNPSKMKELSNGDREQSRQRNSL